MLILRLWSQSHVSRIQSANQLVHLTICLEPLAQPIYQLYFHWTYANKRCPQLLLHHAADVYSYSANRLPHITICSNHPQAIYNLYFDWTYHFTYSPKCSDFNQPLWTSLETNITEKVFIPMTLQHRPPSIWHQLCRHSGCLWSASGIEAGSCSDKKHKVEQSAGWGQS